MKDIVTKSFEETQQIAKDFAKELRGGDVILLAGDLGAGKTTFTQGLLKAFGITKRVISPTFIVMRTYHVDDQKVKQFVHVDLYRLQSEKEIIDLGLLEIMADASTITIIEWPEKLGSLTPKNAWRLQFEHISESERKITIQHEN